MEIPADRAITGADLAQPLDALFVNAPLRDYSLRPRTNDFTLPVLGMAYIATYAASQGFNVGVIDAEALGLGVDQTIGIINQASPRWAGFNLLAPTYEISARIAAGLDPGIQVMAGGHQAKAMPHEVLADPRFARLEALVLGEGETRVAELLKDRRYRSELPGVMWLDPIMKTPQTGDGAASTRHLAPDIDALPFVDRRFLADDPYQAPDGRHEANMVGARGCPYDCSFCGAAVSANPDITIRTRDPENIITEMDQLHARSSVTAFRFVDDLFLGYERFIRKCMAAFSAHDIGQPLRVGRHRAHQHPAPGQRRATRPTGRQRAPRSGTRHRIRQRTAPEIHGQAHHAGHDTLGRAPPRLTRHLRQGLLHPRLPDRDASRAGRDGPARLRPVATSPSHSPVRSAPASSSSGPTPAPPNGTGCSPPASTSPGSSSTTPPST